VRKTIAIAAFITILVGAITYKMVTYDPSAGLRKSLVEQFEHSAAYDASKKAWALQSGADVQTLQKDDNYENSSRPRGVVVGQNIIYWDRVLSDKRENGSGIFSAQVYLNTCYRITANTSTKLVEFSPSACKDMQSLPENYYQGGEEVSLDKKAVDGIRNAHNDNIQCYPGGFGTWDKCKKQ